MVYGAAACWWQVCLCLLVGHLAGVAGSLCNVRCYSRSVPAAHPPAACRTSIHLAAVSTLGSCACYCLSWAVGQPLAHALWPDRLDRYAAEVAARRRELLNYIVFLRVTPILPNTFVNVASPIVGVPLAPFALGEWTWLLGELVGAARLSCGADCWREKSAGPQLVSPAPHPQLLQGRS